MMEIRTQKKGLQGYIIVKINDNTRAQVYWEMKISSFILMSLTPNNRIQETSPPFHHYSI